MADERDPKVSQRYRELRGDEPPRALDRAIMAAAQRATDRPHAPLVTPAGRHRWYFALGAAAILVLAVGIALHIESDRPDPEAPPVSERSTPQPQTTRDATGGKAMEEPVPAAKEQRRAPAASAPQSAVRSDEMRRSQPVEGAVRSEEAMPAESPPASAARVESPDRWLERIVELRKEGQHDAADRQLADFRRRYPDYKIPEAALK